MFVLIIDRNEIFDKKHSIVVVFSKQPHRMKTPFMEEPSIVLSRGQETREIPLDFKPLSMGL